MDEMDPLLNLLNLRPREDWAWNFEPTAKGENAVNAVALCNASLLTYSSQADVQRFLAKWGFEEPTILRGSSTQGFVARRGDIVILAFRGTEPINADDWLSNVNYHQIELAPLPGLLHGGFAKAMGEKDVVKPMLDAVEKLSAGEKTRLFVTGHSLGGALAVLAAALLHFHKDKGRKVAGVFTYGQPRLGDLAFSTAFNQALGGATFRYVNDLDVVPHLPPGRLPALLASPHVRDLFSKFKDLPNEVRAVLNAVKEGEQFFHVGQLLLFRRDGSLTSDEREWQEREVIYSDKFSDLLQALPSLLRSRLGQLLREQHRLLDHDPLNGYLPKLEARLP